MTIIPAINEIDFKEVKKKIKTAQNFGASWVHLDIADGKFTRNKLWNTPKDLEELGIRNNESGIKIEVHLMIQNSDEVLDSWLDAKVKGIIVHLESVRDLDVMKMKCVASGAELFIAINPDTPVEKLFEYERFVDSFLILAVTPGTAGQKFGENQLEKIRALRRKFPDAKIIVDGGVNLENALAIKNAGADILVSASAIWESENPKEAYQKLNEL